MSQQSREAPGGTCLWWTPAATRGPAGADQAQRVAGTSGRWTAWAGPVRHWWSVRGGRIELQVLRVMVRHEVRW